MLLKDKIERAFRFSHDHNMDDEKRRNAVIEAENDGANKLDEGAPFIPEEEVPIKKRLEKGDVFALIFSAFIVILPVALLVLVLISLIGYFFLVR